eukprot:Rmarinus@m.21551
MSGVVSLPSLPRTARESRQTSVSDTYSPRTARGHTAPTQSRPFASGSNVRPTTVLLTSTASPAPFLSTQHKTRIPHSHVRYVPQPLAPAVWKAWREQNLRDYYEREWGIPNIEKTGENDTNDEDASDADSTKGGTPFLEGEGESARPTPRGTGSNGDSRGETGSQGTTPLATPARDSEGGRNQEARQRMSKRMLLARLMEAKELRRAPGKTELQNFWTLRNQFSLTQPSNRAKTKFQEAMESRQMRGDSGLADNEEGSAFSRLAAVSSSAMLRINALRAELEALEMTAPTLDEDEETDKGRTSGVTVDPKETLEPTDGELAMKNWRGAAIRREASADFGAPTQTSEQLARTKLFGEDSLMSRCSQEETDAIVDHATYLLSLGVDDKTVQRKPLVTKRHFVHEHKKKGRTIAPPALLSVPDRLSVGDFRNVRWKQKEAGLQQSRQSSRKSVSSGSRRGRKSAMSKAASDDADEESDGGLSEFSTTTKDLTIMELAMADGWEAADHISVVGENRIDQAVVQEALRVMHFERFFWKPGWIDRPVWAVDTQTGSGGSVDLPPLWDNFVLRILPLSPNPHQEESRLRYFIKSNFAFLHRIFVVYREYDGLGYGVPQGGRDASQEEFGFRREAPTLSSVANAKQSLRDAEKLLKESGCEEYELRLSQLWRLVKNTACLGSDLSLAHVNHLYIQSEDSTLRVQDCHHPLHTLSIIEFAETLFRIAHLKYQDKCSSLWQQMQSLLTNHLSPYAYKDAYVNSHLKFLLSEPTQKFLKVHRENLLRIFFFFNVLYQQSPRKSEIVAPFKEKQRREASVGAPTQQKRNQVKFQKAIEEEVEVSEALVDSLIENDDAMSFAELLRFLTDCALFQPRFKNKEAVRLFSAITFQHKVSPTPHLMNEETEMTFDEFVEYIARMVLITLKVSPHALLTEKKAESALAGLEAYFREVLYPETSKLLPYRLKWPTQ